MFRSGDGRGHDADADHGITHEKLKEEFNSLAFKINSLLAAESPLKDTLPFQEEKVILEAGLRSNYRIYTKDQTVPMRFRVYVQRGVGACFISLSQRIERPSRERCDKSFALTARERFFLYAGEKDHEKAFSSRFMYIGIEAQKPVTLTFVAAFGTSMARPHSA